MLRHRLGLSLLVTALLLGRLTLIAHDADHASLQAKAHACQVCLHYPGLDAPLAPAHAVPAAIAAAAPPDSIRDSAAPSRAVHFYRSRAPPIHLV